MFLNVHHTNQSHLQPCENQTCHPGLQGYTVVFLGQRMSYRGNQVFQQLSVTYLPSTKEHHRGVFLWKIMFNWQSIWSNSRHASLDTPHSEPGVNPYLLFWKTKQAGISQKRREHKWWAQTRYRPTTSSGEALQKLNSAWCSHRFVMSFGRSNPRGYSCDDLPNSPLSHTWNQNTAVYSVMNGPKETVQNLLEI